MPLTDAALFLLLVAAGASIQTIAGFAMGLIIMGGVTALDLAPIAFSAAVVSLVSLVNVSTALARTLRHVDVRRLAAICAGLLPSLIGGVYLLGVLTGSSYDLARRILGLVILLAGATLLFRPRPWERPSGSLPLVLAGGLGGVAGGLFSTAGPPIAFLMYRQPIDVLVIRATLMSVFAISTLSRTVVIAIDGQLTSEILLLTALSIPVVVISTLLAQRAIPYISDVEVRKLVFILLIAVGAYLVVR